MPTLNTTDLFNYLIAMPDDQFNKLGATFLTNSGFTGNDLTTLRRLWNTWDKNARAVSLGGWLQGSSGQIGRNWLGGQGYTISPKTSSENWPTAPRTTMSTGTTEYTAKADDGYEYLFNSQTDADSGDFAKATKWKNPQTGQWEDVANSPSYVAEEEEEGATDPYADLAPWQVGGYASEEAYDLDMEHQRLLNQQLQAQIDNYNQNPTDENYAELRETWTEYQNNYNTNKWAYENDYTQNKAQYDLDATKWAAEQQEANNEYLMNIAKGPMELMPYLYISGGSSTPSWFKSSYKAPTDPWSQIPSYPSLSPYPEMIPWNAPEPTAGAWANGVVDPNQNDYATNRATYSQYSEEDLNRYFAPLTPDQQAESQASYSETPNASRQTGETYQQWWNRLNPSTNSSQAATIKTQMDNIRKLMSGLQPNTAPYDAQKTILDNLQKAYVALGGV